MLCSFRSFAGKIDEFAALSANDRDVLLSSNAPHFVQYVLARYFCADTGLEQGRRSNPVALNFCLFSLQPPFSHFFEIVYMVALAYKTKYRLRFCKMYC